MQFTRSDWDKNAFRGAQVWLGLAIAFCSVSVATAAGGVLNLTVHEEASGEPTTTRVEIVRAEKPDHPMPIRKTVSAGVGVVLDRSLELNLPDGGYQFRMIRGPEYRIISGTFALDRTSLDEHNVDLPRMIDMRAKGWTSGDCLVMPSPNSLPLRMVSEDLHVAAIAGQIDAKPIPRRDRDDPPVIDPMWIREDVRVHDGLAFYGLGETVSGAIDGDAIASDWIAAANNSNAKVVIENPFAWSLPVWLASERIDGLMVLGDWLRLDRKALKVKGGRPTQALIAGTPLSVGRWAEAIYWNVLDAGFRIAPMAGGGDDSAGTPVGYNRMYVADPLEGYEGDEQLEARPIGGGEAWWTAAWSGQSILTNGPMLRPTLGGKIPGHVFTATAGEALQLQPEMRLAVRDPVDYLDVIHNGQVHYSAKLDEFAKGGGVIPPLVIKKSGWVVMRVLTGYEDHYRVAMSAPWYIEFDGQPRITSEAMEFFGKWLVEHETRLKELPRDELARHVPYVKAARAFWKSRAEDANN